MILPNDSGVNLADEETRSVIRSKSFDLFNDSKRKSHFDWLNHIVNCQFESLIQLEMITNQAFLETILDISNGTRCDSIEQWQLNRICNNSLREFLKTNQVNVEIKVKNCIIYQVQNEYIIGIKHI